MDPGWKMYFLLNGDIPASYVIVYQRVYKMFTYLLIDQQKSSISYNIPWIRPWDFWMIVFHPIHWGNSTLVVGHGALVKKKTATKQMSSDHYHPGWLGIFFPGWKKLSRYIKGLFQKAWHKDPYYEPIRNSWVHVIRVLSQKAMNIPKLLGAGCGRFRGELGCI